MAASEWNKISLSDAPLQIIDGDRGSNYPKQDEFLQTGHCLFLNAGNVTISGFNFSNCSFISEKKDTALRKGKAQRNDVILTTRGTVGNVALFDASIPFTHLRINSGMVLLRPDISRIVPRFLYQFVCSTLFKEQVLALTTGSAQPQLPIRDINRIEFPLPPLPEQRAIAHILGALDDKIELNQRMNETLEEMARALFKAWFVDFSPVRAKMEGHWKQGQSLPGLPAHLFDLFPDRLVESEFGEIPEGWRLSTIGEEVVVCGGSTPSTKEPEYWEDGAHCWVTPKDLSALRFPVLTRTERKITDAGLAKISSGLLPIGTVLLSSRAPIGYLAIAEVPTAINQGFIAMKCNESLPNIFVLLWCKENMDVIVSNANGSTFQEISKSNFRPIHTVVPIESLLIKFQEMAGSFYRKMVENEYEYSALAGIRDALLSKLISGELRVQDAEAFLKERGL